MKKIVSILLTVVMLVMSMSVFSVLAEEVTTDTSTDTTTDERMIMDVDFIDYDGANVVDKLGKQRFWFPAKPAAGEFDALDGSGKVKYAQWDDTNKNMFMYVENATSILSGIELTAEMWVKMPDITDASKMANKWPEFFTVTEGANILWKLECSYDKTNNGYIIVDGTNCAGTSASYRVNQAADILSNKWAHVVATRSYKPYVAATDEKPESDNGVLTFNLYINGVLMASSAREVKKADIKTGNQIDFGSSYEYTSRDKTHKYFGGQFGQIRMYNALLSSSDIAEKYNERKAIYQTEEQINFAQSEKFFNNYGTLRNDDWSNYDGSSAGNYWKTAIDAGTYTSENGTSVKYMQWDKSKEQYMQMGLKQGADYILAHDSITAEMWVKFPNILDSAEDGLWPVFFSACTGTGSTLWSLETAYNKNLKGYIQLKGMSASENVTNMANLLGGKWAHIVTSRTYNPAENTTVLKLYVNGELMSTLTENTFERGTNINIGPNYWMRNNAGKKWGGGFGLFKVYKGELSESAIEAKYNEKKSIYQSMDDTAVYEADIANNNVQNSLSGYYASYAWVNSLQQDSYDNGAGISTKYLKFDGTNRFWSYGTNPAQMPTKRFIEGNDETTVEMWLKSDSFNNVNYTPFATIRGGKGIKVAGGWYLEIANGGIAQYTSDKMLNNTVVPMDGKENVWFHVVMTRDFDRSAKTITYKTYVDGALKDTYVLENQTSVNDGDVTTNSVYFGNTWDERNTATAQFNGGIAKAKVYKSILNDAKVASIYNTEKAAFADAGKLSVTDVLFEGEEEGTTINQLKGTSVVWCQITMENSSKQEDKNYAAYGAIYDKSGKLVSIVELNEQPSYGTVNKGTATLVGSATASYTWENLALEAGSTLKVFIWSTDNMMVPVATEVYELPWECA